MTETKGRHVEIVVFHLSDGRVRLIVYGPDGTKTDFVPISIPDMLTLFVFSFSQIVDAGLMVGIPLDLRRKADVWVCDSGSTVPIVPTFIGV